MTMVRPGRHCSGRGLAARVTRFVVAIAAGVACLLFAAGSQAQNFQPKTPMTVPVGDMSGPNSFVLADVNHDTHLDLIAIDQDDDVILVLFGDGNGNFAAVNMGVNSYDLNVTTPTALAVADIGSPAGPPDGVPDIVVAGEDGSADILLGNGDGTFGSPDDSQDLSDFLSNANQLEGVVLADFTGDGVPDLALLDVGDNNDSRVFLLCNQGGNFSTCGSSDGSPIEAGGNNPVDLQSGDFDGDTKTDLVVLSQNTDTPGTGTFSVLYGDGQGNFTVSPQFSATAGGQDAVPQALAVANLDSAVNGNLRDDVVVTNASSFDSINVAVALSQRRSQFNISAASIDFNTISAVALGDVKGVGGGHIDAAFAWKPVESSQSGPLLLLSDVVPRKVLVGVFARPGTRSASRSGRISADRRA